MTSPQLDDRPATELDDRPATELDDRPATELDDRPATELDDRPAIMLTPDAETVDELTLSVEQHLGPLVEGRDVADMVRAALDDLTPVTVRTYLPVLVERRIRRQIA